MPEPAAGVMRMRADDDDQADQQHELTYPEKARSLSSFMTKLSTVLSRNCFQYATQCDTEYIFFSSKFVP